MHTALQSTRAGQHAQTASNQESPLDPNGRHDKIDFDFDDSRVPNPDDSEDDMNAGMSNRQAYLGGAVTDEDDELLGHTRARRRSFEVEAEDYEDWEGFVDADEGEYYGGSEDDEGDEEDENVDEENDEEEDEDAKFDSKYGWSQPQSDRIRYAPPPRPSFNMPSQPSFSRLEESTGAHVTESTEADVSEEQINDGLAEELRRTRLDETQPAAQQ